MRTAEITRTTKETQISVWLSPVSYTHLTLPTT